jgi:hypothetical protein
MAHRDASDMGCIGFIGHERELLHSLKDLIERITDFHSRNIGFKSLTENIDITTSGGKLIFHIFGALAEFEQDIIKDKRRAHSSPRPWQTGGTATIILK